MLEVVLSPPPHSPRLEWLKTTVAQKKTPNNLTGCIIKLQSQFKHKQSHPTRFRDLISRILFTSRAQAREQDLEVRKESRE